MKLKLLTLSVLIFSIFQLAAQPTNDDCETAMELNLGVPGSCLQAATESYSFDNTGASPSIPFPSFFGCTPNGPNDEIGADLWYKFVATGDEIFISMEGLEGANIVLFNGDNCDFLIPISCANGPFQASLSSPTVAGDTYYVVVYGQDLEDQGPFTLTFASINDCNSCYQGSNIDFTANPAPINGTYSSGQQVYFCFTIEQWNVTGTIEWLHAITIDFGPGWDYPNSFVPNPPQSCGGDGVWNWYDWPWVSCNTGQAFGPGFAYDSSSGIGCGGAPVDGDPGNNWGDGLNGCAGIGTTVPPKQFCWTISVVDCPEDSEDVDLSMKVNIWSDGDSGSWTQTGCNSGTEFSFLSTGKCCETFPPIVEVDQDCLSGISGLSITANGGLTPGEAFDYLVTNPAGDTIYQCIECADTTVMTTGGFAAGTYSVYVTDLMNFCTLAEIVDIPNCPVPIISVDKGSICQGDSVKYSLNGGPTDVEYLWVFPDGDPITSTEMMPIVTYTEPGIYGASLLITTPNGNTTSFASLNLVEVLVSGSLDFSISYTPGETTVNVEVQGNGYSNLTWDFGVPNSQATGNTASFTYSNPGIYVISLTGESACGAVTIVKEVEIQIVPPLPSYSQSISQDCDPLIINFSADDEGDDLSYFWLFPGGDPATSTDKDVTVTYAQVGTYDVFLRYTNTFGQTELLFVDAVLVPENEPVADFSADVTLGEATVSFTNESVDGELYAWQFGDGEGSTEENPVHEFPGNGVYSVLLYVSNACEDDTIVKDIEILIPPTGGFTATDVDACAPATISFMADDMNPDNAYFWIFPGGQPLTANIPNPTVSYTNAGQFDVYLTITNSAGDIFIQEPDLVTITSVPTADFSFDQGFGFGEYNFNYTGQGAESFEWDFGDGTVSIQANPQHVFSSSGDYVVTLTVTNACGSDQSIQTLSVFVPELLEVSISPDNGCAPLTVTYSASPLFPNADYSWFFPGGNPNTASGSTVTVQYDQAGIYGYGLVVNGPIGNLFSFDGEAVIIDNCFGSVEVDQLDLRDNSNQIKLFPNPSRGSTNLIVNNWPESGRCQILIYDLLGQEIFQQSWQIETGYWQTQLELDNLVSGVYLVKVQGPGIKENLRLIVD